MHKNLRGIQTLYARLSHWKEEHIKENPSILLLSFVVGVLCALAGWVLKMLIKLIQQWIVHIDELGSIHWL
ncbi:MAG TPA: hypothetical protein DDY68_01235, partial [Porphyromonadaceae bacterium]|nr:hypothetical protein [Porphyromonadaceae bacterium]